MKKIFSLNNPLALSRAASADTGSGLCFNQIGRGLLLSCLLLAVFSLALAAAYCYTSLSYATVHLLQLIALAAAIFMGSFAAARGAGRKGLWHGLLLAALFLGLLLLLNLTGLLGGSIAPLVLLVKALALLLAGGLGGIIGVA